MTFDFPSPIQVIAVLNGQNDLRIARKEYVLAQKCILNGSYLKKYLRKGKKP